MKIWAKKLFKIFFLLVFVFIATIAAAKWSFNSIVYVKELSPMNKKDAYKMLFNKYNQYFEVHTYSGRCFGPEDIGRSWRGGKMTTKI